MCSAVDRRVAALASVVLLATAASSARAGMAVAVEPGALAATLARLPEDVEVEVRVRHAESVTADLSVPWYATLRFEDAGALRIADGVRVRLSRAPVAGDRAIFEYLGPGARVWIKGDQRVNVRWWGARGDGERDDGPAVRRAVESLEDGVVHFPAGIYRLGAERGVALRVPNARLVLAGEGDRSVLRAAGDVAWVVRFEDAEGTGLVGLALEGDAKAGGVRFAAGPMTERAKGARVRLSDVAFRALGGPAVGADPGLDLRTGP